MKILSGSKFQLADKINPLSASKYGNYSKAPTRYAEAKKLHRRLKQLFNFAHYDRISPLSIPAILGRAHAAVDGFNSSQANADKKVFADGLNTKKLWSQLYNFDTFLFQSKQALDFIKDKARTWASKMMYETAQRKKADAVHRELDNYNEAITKFMDNVIALHRQALPSHHEMAQKVFKENKTLEEDAQTLTEVGADFLEMVGELADEDARENIFRIASVISSYMKEYTDKLEKDFAENSLKIREAKQGSLAEELERVSNTVEMVHFALAPLDDELDPVLITANDDFEQAIQKEYQKQCDRFCELNPKVVTALFSQAQNLENS